MCNAHNHSASCTCGFGGEGHLGTARGGNRGNLNLLRAGYFFVSVTKSQHSSDFCRSTTCPRCGAEVYFVRHNGGCVWFDSLGWPWPKHGCFESRESAYNRIRRTAESRSFHKARLFLGVIVEFGRQLGRPYFAIRCSNGETYYVEDMRREGDTALGTLVFVQESFDDWLSFWNVE